LIWLKRLAPFVIIAAAIYAYFYISDRKEADRTRIEHDYALVTAKTWVASAKHRADPDRFLQYRDSMLEACSLSSDDILNFVEINRDKPERLFPFSQLVQEYVDSLIDIEDSLALVLEDSLKAVDTTVQQP